MKWIDRLKNWCIRKLGGYTEGEFMHQKSMYEKAEQNRKWTSEELFRAVTALDDARNKLRKAEVRPFYVPELKPVNEKIFAVEVAAHDWESETMVEHQIRYALLDHLVDHIRPLAAVYRRRDARMCASIYTVRISVNDISALSEYTLGVSKNA